MIKLIYFLNRKPTFSVEDFQAYWRSKHAPLVCGISGVRRYIQNHTLLSGYGRKIPPPVDGIEEIYFDSTKDIRLMEEPPEGQATLEDFVRFVDIDRLRRIVAEEIIIKQGAINAGMVKNIELVTRIPEMSIPDFHHSWQNIHGPLAAKIEMIKFYRQSHAILSEYQKEAPPAFDGIAETWFDNTAAMRLSAATPEYAATREDEKNFTSGERQFVITQELRII